jgi:hypothetical protein
MLLTGSITGFLENDSQGWRMMETSVMPFRKAWVANPARRLWPA